jgi:cyanophycin synthetase
MLDTDETNPFMLDAGMKLVKDERGIRIVETLDEDSD